MDKRDTALDISAILLVFATTRLISCYFIGLSFDASPLGYFWQILDPKLLRENLIESILNAHFQPPAFNLYLGTVLQFFPGHFTTVFQYSFMSIGLLTSIFLYLGMKSLEICRKIALIAALLFTLCPTNLLYENWLFYTYPVAMLFSASIYFLARCLKRPLGLDPFVFFSSVALLGLTRATFHLIWMILCIALVVLGNRGHWKRTLACAALHLLILTGFQLNAWSRFDVYSLSSVFSDSNLAALPQSILGRDEVRQMASKGEVPVDCSLRIFPRLSEFSEGLQISTRKTGIEALDAELKSTGAPNTNNIAYLYAYRQLAQFGFQVVESRPNAYLRYVLKNLKGYLGPAMIANPPPGGRENVMKISPFTAAFNKFFLGDLSRHGMAFVLLIAVPFALGAGIFFVVRGVAKCAYLQAIVCFYIVITVALGSVPLILLAWGDHGRYRQEFDPGYIILLALAIDSLVKKSRSRLSRPDPAGSMTVTSNREERGLVV